MNAVLERAGVLAGIVVPGDLTTAASEVALRPGCRGVLQRAQATGLACHVLSAGYGIVLGSNALLRRVAEAYGVRLLPLQIDAVLGDIGADAVKTGMLPDKNAVQVVADKVRQHAVRQLVVDPVMISTSGHSLADSEVAASLLSHLIPLATLVTPNIPEASALLGGRPITSVSDMGEAAQQLQQRTGCGAVLIKGGHLGP
ncbi:uncharacterized protein HaLaN_16857, partial [Haematococcus lacustris]